MKSHHDTADSAYCTAVNFSEPCIASDRAASAGADERAAPCYREGTTLLGAHGCNKPQQPEQFYGCVVLDRAGQVPRLEEDGVDRCLGS
jgi:hypothetical protein